MIIATYPYWRDEITFKKGGTVDIYIFLNHSIKAVQPHFQPSYSCVVS